MQEIINTLTAIELTSIMGILLYWVPLAICTYGYTVRTWLNYQKDIVSRDEADNSSKCYYPTDTIGTLIGRSIITIMPLGNIFACVFDIAPKLLKSFFSFLGTTFDQPLVHRRK